jgi:DNA repair exonuclease SbcCD ATPase subunit
MDELREALEAARSVKSEAQEWIEKAQRAVAEAKTIKTESNPHDEALETANKQVKAAIKESEGHEVRRIELEEQMAYTQFWVRGYSPQGLPSFLLDAVMPFLTDKANEYLEVLADGDITMSISTQRELKSQKDAVKDEIDIRWIIEGNEGVAKSGGQRTKMNLGMDMSLMDLAASREGIQLDMLLIDEALDGLDRPGTARVLKLLQKMRKRRGTIFVISHNDDMVDMFEKGICVVREDGVSRVETIR